MTASARYWFEIITVIITTTINNGEQPTVRLSHALVDYQLQNTTPLLGPSSAAPCRLPRLHCRRAPRA
jgi:hypothetical protein